MHSKRSISPETLSQAGAGALLAAIGVVELLLTGVAAGWWYQLGASVVAAAGVALLASATLLPSLRLGFTSCLARSPKAESARPVVLVD